MYIYTAHACILIYVYTLHIHLGESGWLALASGSFFFLGGGRQFGPRRVDKPQLIHVSGPGVRFSMFTLVVLSSRKDPSPVTNTMGALGQWSKPSWHSMMPLVVTTDPRTVLSFYLQSLSNYNEVTATFGRKLPTRLWALITWKVKVGFLFGKAFMWVGA